MTCWDEPCECASFAVIAGLRLDTTLYDHYTGKLGATLANHLSAATRIRSKASDQLVTSLRVSAVLSGRRSASLELMR
jgi:hypothetical protein